MCINTSQEIIDNQLDKVIELGDQVRELTATNERLQEGQNPCRELICQPEDRTRRQLLNCEEDLDIAEDALEPQLRLNVGALVTT